MTYTHPEYEKSAFNYPICGAFAKQVWTEMILHNQTESYHAGVGDPKISVCNHCSGFSTKLFTFINIICDNQITQPKQINEFYIEKIPDNLKDAIDKRDGQ